MLLWCVLPAFTAPACPELFLPLSSWQAICWIHQVIKGGAKKNSANLLESCAWGYPLFNQDKQHHKLLFLNKRRREWEKGRNILGWRAQLQKGKMDTTCTLGDGVQPHRNPWEEKLHSEGISALITGAARHYLIQNLHQTRWFILVVEELVLVHSRP